MTKPLGFYAGAAASHPDAAVLDKITEHYGSQLEELTDDDKATALILLVDASKNPQQVFIDENFFSSQNAGEFWDLAQSLSSHNQLMLALAIINQLIYGGR
jgi:hypothetical protein